ncbi:MAG: hypothetical protein J7L54_06945 [Elusimicrobia bacterium]|nr:hypothetical protein [Elusimicrobiota bacterium]
MQGLLNFLGHLTNALLLLCLLILIADIAIKKSGKEAAKIPAGPIVEDTTAMIFSLSRKLIPVEDEKTLGPLTIILIVVVMILVKTFIIR